MSKFDHSDLDGRLLQLLLAVVEEQLGHARGAAPGRDAVGREPPAGQAARHHRRPAVRQVRARHRRHRARRGAGRCSARVLLDELRALCRGRRASTRPAVDGTVTIAANDLQRDLLLPLLLRACARARAGPGAARHSVGRAQRRDAARRRTASWSSRRARRRPATSLQKRLFEDRYRVFYDASQRARRRAAWPTTWPPSTARVHYEPRRALDIDQWLADAGHPAAASPSRCRASPASAPFLRGSALLATLPGLLRASLLRGLASAEPPFALPADADVHGLAPAPPGRPDAPVAARRAAGGGGPGAGRGRAAAAQPRPA